MEYGGDELTFNIYISNDTKKIIDLMWNNSIPLEKICYCTVGINTGYIKDELTSMTKEDNRYHKMLNGKHIGRNTIDWQGEWIMYDVDFVKSKGDRGRSLPPQYIFDNDKILIQRTRRGMKRKLVCYFDTQQFYNLNRISNVVLTDNNFNLKYIYALLNSELMDFYFNKFFNEYEVKPLHLSKLPIHQASVEMQQLLETEVNNILVENESIKQKTDSFLTYIQSQFPIEKFSKKLQNWHELEFGEFINELNKAIKKTNDEKLTKSDEMEWMELFETKKESAQVIKAEIDATDRKIDEMVYELYGLTEDEIAIVEKGIG